MPAGFWTKCPHTPVAGPTSFFFGTVREENAGRNVRAIDYEAYLSMAQKELGRIAREAKKKWGVHETGIAHRLGMLSVGETSLIVVLCAPHRREAFLAGEYILKELKKRVPIFKKEIYADGDTRWLSK